MGDGTLAGARVPEAGREPGLSPYRISTPTPPPQGMHRESRAVADVWTDVTAITPLSVLRIWLVPHFLINRLIRYYVNYS